LVIQSTQDGDQPAAGELRRLAAGRESCGYAGRATHSGGTKGLSPHHDVRSDLQMIVRAYRALTYRGGIDADATNKTLLFLPPAPERISDFRLARVIGFPASAAIQNLNI